MTRLAYYLDLCVGVCYNLSVMLILDEQKQRAKALKAKFDGCCEAFNENELADKLHELSVLQQDPNFIKI